MKALKEIVNPKKIFSHAGRSLLNPIGEMVAGGIKKSAGAANNINPAPKILDMLSKLISKLDSIRGKGKENKPERATNNHTSSVNNSTNNLTNQIPGENKSKPKTEKREENNSSEALIKLLIQLLMALLQGQTKKGETKTNTTQIPPRRPGINPLQEFPRNQSQPQTGNFPNPGFNQPNRFNTPEIRYLIQLNIARNNEPQGVRPNNNNLPLNMAQANQPPMRNEGNERVAEAARPNQLQQPQEGQPVEAAVAEPVPEAAVATETPALAQNPQTQAPELPELAA